MSAVAVHQLMTSGGIVLPGDILPDLGDAEIQMLTEVGAILSNGPSVLEATTHSYTVRDKGRGWYVITDATGAEVTKSLRDDDVSGFGEFSAEDQAAFVAANKPD